MCSRLTWSKNNFNKLDMDTNEKKEKALFIGVLVAVLLVSIIWTFWPTSAKSLENLERYVKEDIQQQLDDNISEYAELFDLNGLDGHISVGDIALVHTEGNKYHGIVEFRMAGLHFNRGVDVITDGDTFIWELE